MFVYSLAQAKEYFDANGMCLIPIEFIEDKETRRQIYRWAKEKCKNRKEEMEYLLSWHSED